MGRSRSRSPPRRERRRSRSTSRDRERRRRERSRSRERRRSRSRSPHRRRSRSPPPAPAPLGILLPPASQGAAGGGEEGPEGCQGEGAADHGGGSAGQDRGGDRDDEADGIRLLRHHQGEEGGGGCQCLRHQRLPEEEVQAVHEQEGGVQQTPRLHRLSWDLGWIPWNSRFPAGF
ncbi:U4/U6.U5 small nuclear ribonucleoprotein 27 kDa protein isoform X1 [Calypte anna]|uniref:U4/U6.U5 small nuclear ribonucleoprotein 27 kDa protein isoform X1 n=1 Tax=Calypte anna TaxID=9244 RepID=UPI0011C3A8A0|nr:U4/U6.U5 small nuclear ribonucleoprotein 27 kDa protein isoform X1 [Calypte anna]